MSNKGIRILQVDDDLMQCEFVEYLWKRKAPDFVITSCQSVSEALELVKTQDFDCVISDYQMSGMDGLEFLQAIRKINHVLPFIFVTGQGSEKIAIEALRAGANDYFTKDNELAKDERLIQSVRNLVVSYRNSLQNIDAQKQLHKLHTAIEQCSSAYVVTDREGNIEFVNSACHMMVGYSPEELQGRKPSIFKSGEHPDDFYADLWKQISTGRVWNGTFLNRRKDGSTYWESASIGPVYDEAGNITHYIKIAKDITESVQLNAEIEIQLEKRKALEDIISNSNSIALNFHYEDVIRVDYISSNINELGVSVEDVVAGTVSVLDIFAPEDQALIIKKLDAAMTNGNLGKQVMECSISDARGRQRRVEFTFWPRRTTGANQPLFQALLTDISELKESADLLTKSEQKYRDFIEHAQDGVVIIQDGIGVYVNNKLYQLLGYSKEELLGGYATDFVHPDEKEKIQTNYQDRLSGMPVPHIYETVLVDKDGNKVFVEVNVRIISHEGRPATMTFIRDISSRRKMQQDLANAQKLEAVGQLAAGIAHEINSPIQYISDNVSFLGDSFGELLKVSEELVAAARQQSDREMKMQPEDTLELLENADFDYLSIEIPKAIQQSKDGLARVAKIVKAMKAFSHPGQETKYEGDINNIVEDIVEISRNEWKYVAELETRLDPLLPKCPVYANEIGQVFLNLITNSAHAIASAGWGNGKGMGRIVIATSKKDDHVEITFTDNGTGIADAIKGKIFNPFFTTKEVGKGTGQGLTISYDVIVNKHQGQLMFESREGKGASFVIRLPLVDKGQVAEVESGELMQQAI